jgi:hypothetical protein
MKATDELAIAHRHYIGPGCSVLKPYEEQIFLSCLLVRPLQ